jgi:hypothetical protein
VNEDESVPLSEHLNITQIRVKEDTFNKLKNENNANITFNVTTTDVKLGVESTVPVYVILAKPTSEPLVWNQTVYSATIEENSPIDKWVLTVKADTPIGKQFSPSIRNIYYKLTQPDHPYYRIDRKTGQIFVKSNIDKEVKSVYEKMAQETLFVQSYYKLIEKDQITNNHENEEQDNMSGDYHFSNIAAIKINIIDVNDNEPYFIHPASHGDKLSIKSEKIFAPHCTGDNMPNDCVIYKFEGFDDDEKDLLKYDLISQRVYESSLKESG